MSSPYREYVGDKYIHPPNADVGSFVSPKSIAIIYDEEEGFQLLLPKKDGDADVTRIEAFFLAMFTKSADEKWVQQMIDEAFSDG